MGLRVGLDVTAVINGATGIARYVTEVGAGVERRGVEVRRFAVGRADVPPPAGTRHLKVPLRIVQRTWRSVGWPAAEQLASGPVDVVHSPNLVPPPSRAPLVVTVHDLAALDFPALHPPRSVQLLQGQVDALPRAAVVLAVSEATAAGVARRGVDRSRIVVTPLGRTPLPAPDVGPVVDGPFLLAVGQLAPRKDLATLVRAFARAGLGGGVRLVLAGPAGDAEPDVRRLASGLDVVFLGAVTDAELAALYRDALALCFPSVAEGFGLPLLEAMGAGLPVVASDIDVVREVCGPDAAVLAPVGDVDRWAEALVAIVDDGPLRDRLALAGPPRAATFTWDRTATGTVEAYERAVG